MSLTEHSPSPIRGNFIPVSGPSTRSACSPTPRTDFGVHLHLNLTDSQMERLASALPGHCSPEKSSRRRHGSDTTDTIQIGITPTDTHITSQDSRGRSGSPSVLETARSCRAHSDRSYRDEDTPSNPAHSRAARSSRSRSPSKRSRSPVKAHPVPQSSTFSSTLSDRRNKTRPGAIDVVSARQYASVSKRVVLTDGQTQGMYHPKESSLPRPATPPLRSAPNQAQSPVSESTDGDHSSYYSEDEFGQARPSYISPLRVRKAVDSNTSPLRYYCGRERASSPDRFASHHNQHRRSGQDHIPHNPNSSTNSQSPQPEPLQTPRNYSPLSEYLTSRSRPVRKEMVGKNGWLERTRSSPEKKTGLTTEAPLPVQQKRQGFLNNLKKIARDMTSSATAMTSSTSRKARVKEQRTSRLTVSLDPREQSLLYCELEFLLTTALDGYIGSQFSAGRLDADKYKKIVDSWQARGRPKVVGFRYDLETQLDLVMLHGDDFRFYGKRAGLFAAVNGVLDMMRVDARAMRIRTFCQPDTVIAKQLLDSQSLFNLIGCCEQQQIQLAEVIQFFKVILEREQSFRRDETVGQAEQDGRPQQRGVADGGFEPTPKRSQSAKASSVSPAKQFSG